MNTQLTTLDSEHEKLTDKMWEVYLAMSHANMLKDRLEEDAEAVKEYLESMDARADSYAVQNVSSSYKCIVERLSDVTDLVEKLNNDYKAAWSACEEFYKTHKTNHTYFKHDLNYYMSKKDYRCGDPFMQ